MGITFFIAASAWQWLKQLGGLGLIALGIADASLVPLPGSIDALTVVLAASNRGWWAYYAAMSTVGSVIGGYLTYRLGQKGGKESLEKKISKPRLEKIYKKFEKGGFGAVFIPALLPPPVPMVPFVLAAGAMEYPAKKFLAALISGRAIRFAIVAWLASVYGKNILGFLQRYYQPILWALVALAVIGGLGGYWFYRSHKARAKLEQDSRARQAA